MQLIEPKTNEDFESYYQLRWEILRKPWNQPPGSEKDELENNAYHLLIKDDNLFPVAVGRLHVEHQIGIIRYMAVSTAHQKNGLGSLLLKNLENKAFNDFNCYSIQLNARENAIPFYLKNGYQVIKKSHLLFNTIQHYLMEKIK
jgi:predicted GNAT family N-acyltransferase